MLVCGCVHANAHVCAFFCVYVSDGWCFHLWLTSRWQLDRGTVLLPHYIQT